jgi:uncharacterized membrane protein YeaQ/YmgE (transglycosylase-associated protein family)
MNILIFLVIGGVAGFLAGKLMKNSQSGIIRNVLLGVVGAIVGGFLFGLIGIQAGGLIGSILTATIGAALVIYLAELIQKKK